MEESMKEPPIK